MKKLKYTIIFITAITITAYSQADIIVEDESSIAKTVTIGSFINTNEELTISDIGNDGKVEMYLQGSNNQALYGIQENQFILNALNNDITFRTNNITRTRLLTNGDWGIGTGSPQAILHVADPGISNTNTPVLLLESVVARKPVLQFSEGGISFDSGMAWFMDGTPTQNRLHIRGSQGSELVTFSNLIRFGIDVIGDPRETLEVNGNILLTGAADLRFMQGATELANMSTGLGDLSLTNFQNNGDIELISEQNDVRLEAITDDVIIDSGDDIAFRIGGVNQMFMRPSGRLGINDSSLNSMIDIKQKSLQPGLRIQDNANADSWSFEIAGNDLILSFNNTSRGSFDDVDGFYTALSDRRLKKEIQPLKDGVMAKLMKLKVSEYNYIDDESKEPSIGIMAQDLLIDFPELVTTRVNKNGEEYYSVSYDLLNVLVVKAIQEQDQKKKALQKQLKELQSIDDEMKEVSVFVSSITMKLEKFENQK